MQGCTLCRGRYPMHWAGHPVCIAAHYFALMCDSPKQGVLKVAPSRNQGPATQVSANQQQLDRQQRLRGRWLASTDVYACPLLQVGCCSRCIYIHGRGLVEVRLPAIHSINGKRAQQQETDLIFGLFYHFLQPCDFRYVMRGFGFPSTRLLWIFHLPQRLCGVLPRANHHLPCCHEHKKPAAGCHVARCDVHCTVADKVGTGRDHLDTLELWAHHESLRVGRWGRWVRTWLCGLFPATRERISERVTELLRAEL